MSARPVLPLLLVLLALVACTSTGAPDPVGAEASEGPGATMDATATASQSTEAEPRPWERAGVRTAYSRTGTYLVKFRPIGGPIPKNRPFELELWVFQAPADPALETDLEPVPGLQIGINAWMPAHGHGMVRQPRATDRGDGSYLVRGMLFHMGGHWQLFFDVIEEGLAERVQFDVEL